MLAATSMYYLLHHEFTAGTVGEQSIFIVRNVLTLTRVEGTKWSKVMHIEEKQLKHLS